MQAIFFDLDGTLLPMDQELFVKIYMEHLINWVAPRGFEPKKLADSIWYSTLAVMKNDGSVKNEQRFWDKFTEIHGQKATDNRPYIDGFYTDEFNKAKVSCAVNEKSREVVGYIKRRNIPIILATNPVFPQAATFHRIRWAGLEPSDFLMVTTYENSSFCKPNPKYYLEILEKLGLRAEECLMVGNDADEDMAAQSVGMKVFLLTDCIINRHGRDISGYKQGNMDDLLEYLKELLDTSL